MTLEDSEKRLATLTARLIVQGAEIGLPDAPHQLVSASALRLLAHAYVELIEQLRSLHGLDPTRPIGAALAEAGLHQLPNEIYPRADLHAKLWQPLNKLSLTVRSANALANAGVTYVGELVQADRSALLTIKNFGKQSLREIEGKLAQQNLQLGIALDEWPGPRWRRLEQWPYFRKVGTEEQKLPIVQISMSGGRPTVSAVTTAKPEAASSTADLLDLYCRVMHENVASFSAYPSYILRVWDGMDGCWTDCTQAVSCDEALRRWAKETDQGSRRVAYAEIDYYRIFPGSTQMLWNGAEGREMHR